jgi:O-antigen/teichoic acid export membrane protein
VLRNTLGVLTNSVAITGFAMAANILGTRMIGPEQRGAYAVAAILAMTLTIAVDFGMRSALLYNLSQSQNQDDAISEGIAVCANLLLFSIAIASILYVIIYAIGHNTFLKGVNFPLLLLSFAYCLLALVLDIFIMLFIGIRDFRGRNLVALVSGLGYFTAVATWYLVNWKLTATLMLTLNVGGLALAAAAGLSYLKLNYHPRWAWSMPPDWRSRYLNYGLKSLVAQLTVQGNARLDTFIVNTFLGNLSVGMYSAGVSLAESSQHVVNAAATVLYPEIGQREGRERLRITLIMIGGALYTVILVSIGLAIAMPWLLPALFGKAFAPGVAAGLWLLPGMAGLTLFRMMGSVTSAHGKPEYRTYAGLAGITVTVALDFLLIPRYGIIGAAWASSIAYTVLGGGMTLLYISLGEANLQSVVRGFILEPIYEVQHRLTGLRGLL